MFLTSLMHRDELFEITMRWLNNNPQDDDGRRLSEIFLFESAVSAPIVQDIMLGFFTKLYGGPLSVERVEQKEVLRSRIIEGIPQVTPRIHELVSAYQTSPEEFFPGMPVDAVLLSTPKESLAAISRIKRPTRVAEKAAFRLTDALADRVRQEAEVFASARALARGVPLQHLISSETQMNEDFVAAERVVANEFRDGKFIFEREQLTINDIIGFKLVGDETQLLWAERMLAEEPAITVVEREEHRGHYNATNLLLDIHFPPVGTIIDNNAHRDWHQAVERGLDPAIARQRFAHFVESGSRSIRTEVILTTYPELIESELGRSLHELRILRLRERQSYAGQIAQNVRYLIEYLFALAYAPTVEVSGLPIKLWGRYLPDTVLTAVGQLYGMSQIGLLKWFLPE